MSEDQRPAELHDLDRETCFALLASQHVGRLVLPGDEVFVAPVNYVVVGESLVFRTDAGSHAAGAAGETMTFEVDAVNDQYEAGWSVVIRGRLQDITDAAAADVDLHERLESWAPGPKDRWLRIDVEDVTGRWLRGADRRPPLDGRGYI
jgi:nitroimidazol reductase NimA-like FMN-containing flavoprotein (pyridoxamine 5'-phosphate oxidase superfamily)